MSSCEASISEMLRPQINITPATFDLLTSARLADVRHDLLYREIASHEEGGAFILGPDCYLADFTTMRRAWSEGDGPEPDKLRIATSLQHDHDTRHGPSTAQQRRWYQRRVTIATPESGPYRGIRVKRSDPRRGRGERSHFETHQIDVNRDIWATDPAVDSWQLGFLLIHLKTGKNWFKEEMMQKPKVENGWLGALDENEDDFDLRAVGKLHA